MDDEMNTCCTDLVPFTYASPFAETIKLGERQVEIFGQLLRLAQGYENDGQGGTGLGFGASVYNASIVLSLFVESQPQHVYSRNVVELGCGPGLVSITAALARASCVVCTDGDQTSLTLAAENVSRNVDDSLVSRISIRRLLWGDEEDLMSIQSLLKSELTTIVLASDVVAPPYIKSYNALIATMLRLTSKGGYVLMSYQRRHSSDDIFWRKFSKVFTVEEISRELIHPDFRMSPISILKATPISS
jgi:predicted nicotinamide N-methyase